ncbi:hypothetical protein H5410_003175 [Solanum commersonii]|uniref:Uncharacterized protein n=1 Tax=Solanum commersonii TaxID=4109 RepID=A0A9J6B4D8_SOLCO|nr:hypothetical protein H5410_003175 [Solanum commersonii]
MPSVIQTSLTKTSMAAPSWSGIAIFSEVTPNTVAQVQTNAPGSDAQTDRATVSTGSPLYLHLCLTLF